MNAYQGTKRAQLRDAGLLNNGNHLESQRRLFRLVALTVDEIQGLARDNGSTGQSRAHRDTRVIIDWESKRCDASNPEGGTGKGDKVLGGGQNRAVRVEEQVHHVANEGRVVNVLGHGVVAFVAARPGLEELLVLLLVEHAPRLMEEGHDWLVLVLAHHTVDDNGLHQGRGRPLCLHGALGVGKGMPDGLIEGGQVEVKVPRQVEETIDLFRAQPREDVGTDTRLEPGKGWRRLQVDAHIFRTDTILDLVQVVKGGGDKGQVDGLVQAPVLAVVLVLFLLLLIVGGRRTSCLGGGRGGIGLLDGLEGQVHHMACVIQVRHEGLVVFLRG